MKPHQLLKKYLERKQKVNPKYSLRAFARDLKVNAGFVSRMLNGNQEVPLKRLGQIARILDLDTVALNDLKKAIACEFMSEIGLSTKYLSGSTEQSLATFEDKAMTAKDLSALSPWYNIAILELCTCEDFQADSKWIADRLNITQAQVEKSVTYLQNNGYLEEQDGLLVKTHKHIRFPTKQSTEIVRYYHKSMMELAVKEMFQKTDTKRFHQRLITSTSIAVNPENIAAAKERMAEFQLKLAEMLREGPCTEVFDLTMALFPLTRSRDG